MKEQHILFINMPALPLAKLRKETASRGIRAFPFGILYLSAILKKQKHLGHIACVDYLAQDSESFAEDLDKFIISEAVDAISPYIPDILAFSLSLSSSYDFFCHCLPLLRKTWPKAKVIVGGMHASNAVEFLLENHDIDYLLAGEAEESFPLLLACLLEQEEKPVIKGVHWRGGIRYDLKGKPQIAAPIENLNLLPFPDWSLLKMDCYAGQAAQGAQIFWEGVYTDRVQNKHASLLTTRGCPFNCTFCASHSIHARKMRVRDVPGVIEEMRQLNKGYGINCFHIFDDLALCTTKRALDLLRAMNNSGIEDLQVAFTQTLSVSCTNEETIDALIDYTGARTIAFAVETGHPQTQKAIKKHCDLDKAGRLIRYAQSRGLIVTINILLGFPEETREQMLYSISYVKEYLKPNWTQFFIATPIIGTEMYDQFIKAGCITNSPQVWNNTLIDSRYFDSPWITAEELNELRYRANLECNFADNYDLQCGNYDKALVLFRGVTRLYPFHIFAWDGIRRAEKLSGNEKEAKAAKKKIKELVLNDSLPRELLEKYGDLFPEVVEICKVP
ncbi:MAG: radical SAM protein [Candidatus Omnitrophota bacterium]|nr:radical SAM protein [Candidatus Omnitrophota bacterium]